MRRTCPMITDPNRVREALRTMPVPTFPTATAATGMAWLRAHVPRFSEGPEHARRRALVIAELDRLSPTDLRHRVRTVADHPLPHIEVLLKALGLHHVPPATVAVIAAHYQPHEPDSPAADTAVDTLVARCGGTADDVTAARICVLVQACAATDTLVTHARALLARRAPRPWTPDELLVRTMIEHPPLRSTRRVIGGEQVEIELRHPEFSWGAGPHACPGRTHAIALAAGILEGARA
ncbi:cytochrome P450 [Nocardia otitidiscaviarum]|uniref:cytochrome P450 n=1 Tax=Nocardia otitidiscaviarum TaxID=1823 RepID=UPI001E6481D1|nr:cytochrome P450 [Nocardia otitidiscaviarum]